MTAILLIDTASRDVAIATVFDGQIQPALVADGAREHSSMLLQLIDRALGGRKSALTGVGVVLGPGSYAGLRVGIATAEGIALSLGLPIRGVPTMDSVARASGLDQVTAVHPAGRGVYAVQQFAGGVPAGPLLGLRQEEIDWTNTAGEGAGERGGVEIGPAARCEAALLALIPEFERNSQSDTLEAVYLRDPNITVPKPRFPFIKTA